MSPKCPLFSPILMKLELFSDRFSKNTQIPNFMNIRPVEAEIFHADGQTANKELKVAFRIFSNAPTIAPRAKY
jgi:hypothetical protein